MGCEHTVLVIRRERQRSGWEEVTGVSWGLDDKTGRKKSL